MSGQQAMSQIFVIIVRQAVSEIYNNSNIFKTGPRIHYRISVYIYNTYDTVQYITIQFQQLIIIQHNTLLQYIFVQFIYYSCTLVQRSLLQCLVYSQATVVYFKTLIQFTLLYMYCIVENTHNKYKKIHVMQKNNLVPVIEYNAQYSRV